MNDRGRFIGITAFAALVAAGCSSARLGPSDGSVARATEVRALQDEIAGLEAECARLSIELGVARGASAEGMLPAGLPTPVRVVEASGSAVRLGRSEAELRLRVRTEDSRNRFLQTTGPATVTAVGIDDAGDPVDLGSWEVDVIQWREGLREGFMGTAYAIDLPIETVAVLELRGDPPMVLVRTEVRDPRSDTPYRTEFAVPVIDAMEEGAS
ncbi:MAG: hypothetical protein P8J59_02250 [Phycisphaerales bacterium]|nr:hypothetical protein [Phycisphaerales bacterium]